MFYVRTDLWGDYEAWRKNGEKDDFRGLWAKEKYDREGLFSLIKARVPLHDAEGKAETNNWRFLFRNSVDLRTDVRRRLKRQAMRRRAEQLMDAGQLPIITVMNPKVEVIGAETSYKTVGDLRFTFGLVNGGPVPAIGIVAHLNVGTGRFNGAGAKIGILQPGNDAATRIEREVKIEVTLEEFETSLKTLAPEGDRYTLRLVVGYTTPAGHCLADVSFVYIVGKNHQYRSVDTPTYVGKSIGGYRSFQLDSPWEA